MLRNKYVMFAPLGLLGLIVLSGAFLMSSYSYATDDSAVDNVSITVPVSCTMSGTGMNSHNATIPNGTYEDNIGVTTIKVYCNDNEGFSIYAIGYSDNEDGKTVLASTISSSYDIATGTATSGNDSNWAMRLSASGSSFVPTLENGFGSYSAIPASHTKVASYASATDVGSSATGSTITTTYAAYIKKTQPADTYSGKVKYTLIHPSNADQPTGSNQIVLRFHSEEYTFENGTHVNEVTYGDSCTSSSNTEPVIIKSANLNNVGEQSGSYGYSDATYRTIKAPGASQMRVEIKQNTSSGTILAISDDFDSDNTSIYYGDNQGEMEEETIVINGDSVSMTFAISLDPVANHDYGYYILVYPVYDSPTNKAISNCAHLVPIEGSYSMPVEASAVGATWFVSDGIYAMEVPDYFIDNLPGVMFDPFYRSYIGTIMDIHLVLPAQYTLVFDANGGSGTMTDQTIYNGDNIKPNSFTPPPGDHKCESYSFGGWRVRAVSPNDGGIRILFYSDGESMIVNTDYFEGGSTINLEAIWIGNNCNTM